MQNILIDMTAKKSLLYYEVMNYLVDRIANEFKPGDIIPTQTEIAAITQTSLITVKRAVNELVSEGILETIAGKGTFVKSKPLIDNHVGVSSWTDSIAGIGVKPQTLDLIIEKHVPTKDIAHTLQLKARKQTILIKRIRGIEQKPVCIMHNEIPLDLVPGLDKKPFDAESFYVFLKENYNLVPAFAQEEVYAREATEQEMRLLNMNDNIVLIIKRTSYLEDQTPFEVSKIIAPASEYRYRSKQVNSSIKNINSFL